jgi:Tol biopolymer transport system component
VLGSLGTIVVAFLAASPHPEFDQDAASTRQLAAEVHSQGWLIFSARSTQGDWDLFACRPDGTDRRSITATPEYNEAAPQVSRDGRKLLYRRLPAREPIDGNLYGTQGELVISSSDGSTPVVIGTAGEFPWASWSPDGKQLACLTIKGILIVDVATRQVVRSLPRKGFFQQLTWSPDGKWLVGVSNAFGASWSVARMELSSGETSAVSGADCCTPDWFPGSQAIIYSNRPAGQKENQGNGWTQLWMASPDGRNRRLVYGEDGRHVYGGHVSPDGKYVVFTGNMYEDGDPRDSGAPMGLMRLADAPIVAVESRELRQIHRQAKSGPVLVLPAGWEPCWTLAELVADGRPASLQEQEGSLARELHDKGWIAFSALMDRGDWDLFVMRPDGSSRRTLIGSRDYHEAGVRFSPDGRKLLYYRIPRAEAVDNNTYGTYELVTADADGQNAVVRGRGFQWAAWGPDATEIACLSRRWIMIMDVNTWTAVRRIPRRGIVQQLVWSPDGRYFAGTANGLGPYWNIGRLDSEGDQIDAVSETERYNCTPDWMPDSRSILYSRGIVPETGGHAEIWLASGDGREKKMLYASETQHLYGSCPSPDGKYLLLTRSDVDLGRVEHSGTRMTIVRMADTPIVVGSSPAFQRKYADARPGPSLWLTSGWEPHWTYAEIGQPQPEH